MGKLGLMPFGGGRWCCSCSTRRSAPAYLLLSGINVCASVMAHKRRMKARISTNKRPH